jgi:hypothetical protein
MKMMVGRGALQFNAASEPQWGPGILHFPKVLFLDNVKASVCKQNLGNVEE